MGVSGGQHDRHTRRPVRSERGLGSVPAGSQCRFPALGVTLQLTRDSQGSRTSGRGVCGDSQHPL